MKGIVRLINKRTEALYGYYGSQDIKGTIDSYNETHMLPNKKRRFPDRVSIEIVEVTDKVGERLAKYVLPQISRVSYDEALYDAFLEQKLTKRIVRAVDWVVETYTDKEYSFVVSVICDGTKKHVKVLVQKNGERYEEYIFVGTKEPVSRTVF